MKLKTVGFLSILLIGGAFALDAFCAIQASSRVAPNASVRSTKSVSRQPTSVNSGVRRSATERGGTTVSRKATTGRTNSARMATKSGVARSTTSARSGILSNIVRAAKNVSSARSATVKHTNAARATAVFNDISKMGSGYVNCRDAYATCMDQFCAKLNDTYRRCICSSKYEQLRNTEDGIEEALTLLAKFEDNNLNAVDKTAEEVNAMYTATSGEMAIKNDTSGAAQMLSEIGDLLSGKKTAKNNAYTSTNGTTIDFDFNIDDIWAVDVSQNSIFGSGDKVEDISTYEGTKLYNTANEQCLAVVRESCPNDATLSMSKSSYSIMVTNDCNTYSKKIDAKREKVQETVRTAEKYLREARLEEYRSHNSADMNACVTAVKNAIQEDSACGSNYVRCLDNTGVFINSTTGEPIYSQRLFELNELITLDGSVSSDVLTQNRDFEAFLDSKRKFATTALDTCRDIAEDVWTEFKRTALIEIAQAQDDKIEEVKMSCVQTIAECYDTQLGVLKETDTSKSQLSGAIGVKVARDTCQEKVVACASLYGDTDGCKFDGNGRLTSGNNATGGTNRCGLDSLLEFVDNVDTSRVAEACDTMIDNHLQNLCTQGAGEYGYPYGCRNMTPDTLKASVQKGVGSSCSIEGLQDDNAVGDKIKMAMDNISEEMSYVLGDICEELEGFWVAKDTYDSQPSNLLPIFYRNVYGGRKDKDALSWGVCIENSVMVQCLAQNSPEKTVATYNAQSEKCEFTSDWFKMKCESIGGYYENDSCYVEQ